MASKYSVLAGILREELLHGGISGGYKFPTEAELARRYRMSRQTVRHAIQLLAEEGLVATRQGSGIYATGKPVDIASRQVAVITSFLDDYIFPTVLHDAQTVFAQEGYSTLVFSTENEVMREREILCKLLLEPVRGILVEGAKTALPNPNIDLYQKLRQADIPIVFLHGAYSELTGVPCVSDDNYGGGYQLARYLIGKGHKNIAGIFKCDDIQGPQRYHGVVCALRDAGLPIHDDSFRWYDTHDRAVLLDRRDPQLLKRFWESRSSAATAVICYNDEIAHLLVQALLSMKISVPEDMAVVSFDNSYYSQIGSTPITSLCHRNNKMGRVAAEQLIHMFQGAGGSSHALAWELIERTSG